MKALASEPYGQLTHNVAAVLRYIGNRFEQDEARDPATEDNVVSNDLSAKEKKAIAKAARDGCMTRTGRTSCGDREEISYVSTSAIGVYGVDGRDVVSNVSAKRSG